MTLDGAILLCPIYALTVGYLSSRQAKAHYEAIDQSRQYTLKEIGKTSIDPLALKYGLLIALPTAVYAHFPKEQYEFVHPLYQQAVDANQSYLRGVVSILAAIGGNPKAASSPYMWFNYFFPLCVGYAIIIPAIIALIPASFYIYKSVCLNVRFPTSNRSRKIIGLILVGGAVIALCEFMVNHIHMFQLRGFNSSYIIAERTSQFVTLLAVLSAAFLLFIPLLFQSFRRKEKR